MKLWLTVKRYKPVGLGACSPRTFLKLDCLDNKVPSICSLFSRYWRIANIAYTRLLIICCIFVMKQIKLSVHQNVHGTRLAIKKTA